MKYRSSALVGRDDELGMVGRALGDCRSGRGGAIFVAGEAGIGKSRLAAAAVDLASAAGMRLMRGRSGAMGPLAPLRPLTEAVLFLLRSADPPDLAALGPYRPVLGRLVPDLRSVPHVDSDPSLVILGEAVLRLMTVAGRDRGCLLVLDDLHEADPETLTVVEYIVDNIGRQPALVIGTMRAAPCPARDIALSATQRGLSAFLELARLTKVELTAMVGECINVSPEQVPDAAADLLWEGSTGNPFLIEDLLNDLIDAGALAQESDGWHVTRQARTDPPQTFVRSVRRRADQLPGPARELILAGALLGYRFPLPVVRAVGAMTDRELLRHLQGPLATYLVSADDQTPDWYRFQHPLIREATLTLFAPTERARLAARTADAVLAVYPGLPGEWCQVSAGLRIDAGDPIKAAELFVEAGRRCLAQGAANSAVALLDKAWDLLGGTNASLAQEPITDVAIRADALESLIHALTEAGFVDRALATVDLVDHMGMALNGRGAARVHTRLAWAAMLAGNPVEAQERVRCARAALRGEADDADVAAIDVVAAHVELDLPGQHRRPAAEAMARRAATVAESVPLPVVACQAWQLLGALVRHRDPAEATACLERSRALAVRHDLPIWEVHALVRLGNDDALRDGSTIRLEHARAQASRIGAVTARYQAEASIALQCILRGEFTRAQEIIDEVLAATSRIKLVETAEYVLLLRATLAAHLGRRREMEQALADLTVAYGQQVRHVPRMDGLARAFCSLLEEDRARAIMDLSRAVSAEANNPTMFHLTGRQGILVLLTALAADPQSPGSEQEDEVAPDSLCRWDRQFNLFASAVVAGRRGDRSRAAGMVAQAIDVGESYPVAVHLGLRLVSEAALGDGWGTPIEWLRRAEDYFHGSNVLPVAGACRALLRGAGIRVAQRRTGITQVPPALRSVGVTVREFEVLRLLRERLGNREIAQRLHLSPRTIERHVSNLITKTGRPNRLALSELIMTNDA